MSLSVDAQKSSITISWGSVSGAATYSLSHWDYDNGRWIRLVSSKNVTSFVHAGLTVGQTYQYTARAENSNGVGGPWSDFKDYKLCQHPPQRTNTPVPPTNTPVPSTATPVPSAATPTPQPGLPAVQNVTPSASKRRVNISWSPVNNASSYKVAWWHNLDDGWQYLPNTTGTSASHTGATPGETYYYAVCALDPGENCANWSDYTQHATVPNEPTNLQVRKDVHTSNSLSWDGFDGAASFIIEVRARSDNTDWNSITWVRLQDTPVVSNYNHDAGIVAGWSYQYRVHARDSGRNMMGVWSNTVTHTVPTSTPAPTRNTRPAYQHSFIATTYQYAGAK